MPEMIERLAAVSTSMIAFGGLSWSLDGASAPAGAVLRLQAAMSEGGGLVGRDLHADGMPAREIRSASRRVGSHAELMANGSQYSELYEIQAAAYR